MHRVLLSTVVLTENIKWRGCIERHNTTFDQPEMPGDKIMDCIGRRITAFGQSEMSSCETTDGKCMALTYNLPY